MKTKSKTKKKPRRYSYIQWRNQVHELLGFKPEYKFMKQQYNRGLTPIQFYETIKNENLKHENECN